MIRGSAWAGRLRWVLLAMLGAAVVIALVAVDPAATALLLDVEFLGAIGAAGLALIHGDLREVLARVRVAPAAVLVRAGVRVTRDRPRSLWHEPGHVDVHRRSGPPAETGESRVSPGASHDGRTLCTLT